MTHVLSSVDQKRTWDNNIIQDGAVWREVRQHLTIMEPFPAIEGTLVALSHTFKIRSDVLFLAEMCCCGEIHHVLVKKLNQLYWHQLLEVGSRFRITNLKPSVLYKGDHNVPVLHTSQLSQLIKLEDEHDDGVADLKLDRCLISYKGVISAVIDKEAGVYELDGRIRLVISYLLELTGELWNNDLLEDHVQTVTTAGVSDRLSGVNRLYNCIDVGDYVMVYHAHHSKIAGILHLICCGRSFVRKKRNSPVNSEIRKSQSSVVDVVHAYNPGILGLIWLLNLQRCLIAALCPGTVDEKYIKRRQWNGNRGLLTKLIKEAARRNIMNKESRSLLKEFLLSHHQCIVTREFVPPFTLVSVASLKTSVNEDHIECKNERLWHHAVLREDEPRVLVGKLQLGENGVLQIHQQESKIDFVIVGNKDNLFDMVGTVVAIYKFDLVEEKFCLIDRGMIENVCKKYILNKCSDVVVLNRPLNETQEISSIKNDIKFSFEIKIISKSGIVFNNPQVVKASSQNLSHDMFFIAQGIIESKDCHTIDKKWQKFVKFYGENALIHSCIQDGYCCMVQIPKSVNVELMMKKSQASACLRPLQSHFGTCECVSLPAGSSVIAVTQEKPHQSEINVIEVLDPLFEEGGLVSVTGIVKDKQYMTPKFASELRQHPSDTCNDYHIGIPGNKIIRILLQDNENAHSEIWLYFSSSFNNFTLHYPLAVIPGVRVIASCVQRNTSQKSKMIYLKSTVFTCLTPVTLPDPKVITYNPTMNRQNHYFLQDLSNCHGAFQCFATVGQIQKVSFNTVCNSCNSEMAKGSCTYIGCHAESAAKMTASAQVVIDDGTATALVFMNSVEQVQILLQLTHNQFASFNQHIVSGCHQLTYFSKQRDSGCGVSSIFENICSSDQLLRPLTFSCRKFSSQSQGNSQSIDRLHLYCLSLSELKPKEDFKTLLKYTKH